MRGTLAIVFATALSASLALPALADQGAGLGAADDAQLVQVHGRRGDNDERRNWRHSDRDRYERVQLLPLEIILSNVASRYPGHHIGVDGPMQRGGRLIYRIKWLTPNGRVLFIFVDAQTGRILGER
jgi:uncharacterized membrane protein YkoI